MGSDSAISAAEANRNAFSAGVSGGLRGNRPLTSLGGSAGFVPEKLAARPAQSLPAGALKIAFDRQTAFNPRAFSRVPRALKEY